MKKTSHKSIKKKTTDEIYDGISQLVIDDNPELITINNIAKRSGYSIGNIYHHFKNIDEVIDMFVSNRIEKRTHVIIDLIENTHPTQNSTEILKSYIDINFEFMRTKLPKKMFLLLAAKVFDKPNVKEKLMGLSIAQARALEAMIKINKTNTFKNLTSDEIELAAIMVGNAIRAPIISNHKLALTKSHQEHSLTILLALLVK